MFLSALFVRGLVSELERRGLATSPLLTACGIPEEAVFDLRARISSRAAGSLAVAAIRATDEPALGLEIGARAPEYSLQVLSHLILSCKTLRHAIARFLQFSSYMVDDAEWELREIGRDALFTYRPAVSCGDAARLTAESVLAMALRLARPFVAEHKPKEVWFCHAEPSYSPRYRLVFQCPVRFSQPSNTLVFAAELLDRSQLAADSVMEGVLANVARQLLQANRVDADTGLRDRVRMIFETEPRLNEVDTAFVARRLGTTPRVLTRDLAREGTNVWTLFDHWRREVACDALRRPDACIRITAKRLGFSEPSAFHRAFKRWTGQTPLHYMRMGASAQERV